MERQQIREEGNNRMSHLQPGMAFLSENPEAFGYLPDACPAATSELLVAANGQSSVGDAVSPMYLVEGSGVDALFDDLFGGLIHRTDENTRLLRATFGEKEEVQEHPVARYCAALAEAAALQILDGPAKGASYDQIRAMLGSELPRKLARLRETVSRESVTARDPVFYTISLGACRLMSHGEGRYTVDIFSAGDFRFFLLDGEGLHPLWLSDTPALSPEDTVFPMGCTLNIHHPEPFALLLLSDSICALNAAENRLLREKPGMIWRYRMRLEDQFLRLIASCVREQEFGERASRYFTGRFRGRDSASGAMTIVRNGVSYEVFRAMCAARLSHLEGMISLLPEGYDPDRVPKQILREDMERAHLHHLLEREKDLADRVTEMLRRCALEKLSRGDAGEVCPPPANVPSYRRLGWGEVRETYRRYDRENDADRAGVERNRRILRDNLTDHWIVLRPCFAKHGGCTPSPEARRSYAACVEMSARLGKMLTARGKVLNRLELLLSDGLHVLRTDGKDWMEGRAGDGSVMAWAENLSHELPDALEPLMTAWQEETDRYRSLYAAYSYERELLFRMDTKEKEGFFAEDWQEILNGTLSEERWSVLCGATEENSPYRALIESLRRVSKGTGALLGRIEARGAERRMAGELAGRTDLQLAALRASAYEDGDWGESVVSIMEPSLRREHREAVRRWQESCELAAHRKNAYADYKKEYEVYLSKI